MNKLPGRFSSMSDLVNYLKESESVLESIGSTLKSAFQLLPPLPKSVDNESEENQSMRTSFHTHESYSAPRLPAVKLVTCSPMSPLVEMHQGYDLYKEKAQDHG